MIKFSALYHEVWGRYSPNKGQNCSFSSPKILCRPSFDIFFFVLFERAPQDAVLVRAFFFKLLSFKQKKGLTSSITQRTLKNSTLIVKMHSNPRIIKGV